MKNQSQFKLNQMQTKSQAEKIIGKINTILPDLQKKIISGLQSHQKKNTKIKIDYDERWATSDDFKNAVISIDISYFCHGKHPSEGNWIYFLKRGISFVPAEKEFQDNILNPVFKLLIFHKEEYVLAENISRDFTLRQLLSQKTINAIVNYLNTGNLNLDIFLED